MKIFNITSECFHVDQFKVASTYNVWAFDGIESIQGSTWTQLCHKAIYKIKLSKTLQTEL